MKQLIAIQIFVLAFYGIAIGQPITRHALLVGIGSYPKASKWPLLHSDQDAKKLGAELKKHDFLDRNIHQLINQSATQENITIELKKIFQEAEPEDQVILYFGGHSQQITDVSGDETDHLDEAFVAYDALPVFSGSSYAGNAHLLDDDLARWVQKIAAKVTRFGSVFVLYDGGLSTVKKTILPQKGPFPAFKISSYFKVDEPQNSFDNEWIDVSYTEEFNHVVSLDPGEPGTCSTGEKKLEDGTLGSPLVSGFLKGVRLKPLMRYRELSKFISSQNQPAVCTFHLDGALQLEVFKSAKEKQFESGKGEMADSPNSEIFSITIGVSHYQNIDPLEYGHEDALMFGSMLQGIFEKKVNPENQFIFIDSNATIKPIIDALETINSKVKEGDKIYFYFAGHGDVENLLTKKAHLLLFNSPSHVYKAGGTLPVEDVKDYLKQWIYKRAKVFMVVDACKSGKLAGGLQGQGATLNSLQEIESNSARLLSCHPNESSLEGKEYGGGHGAFTYYLVKGLSGMANADGDQKISIQEIRHFLIDSVSNATQQAQNPMVEGNKNLAFFPSIPSLALSNKSDLAVNKSQTFKSSNTSEDSLRARWIRELRFHCASKNIIFPEANCAKATFVRITNTFPLEKKQIESLKLELQNAIDKKSQSLINEYIQGNEKYANEEMFAVAAKELEYLLDLMDFGNQLYFIYLSRKYFFEGRSIKPTLVDNDLQRFKLKKAIQNLETALKYEPEGAQNYNAIGRLRQVNREYESAISSYKKAIQLAPSWKFPISNLAAAFDEYAQYKKLANFEDSAIFYNYKAIGIDPNYAVAYKNLGKAYWNQGKPEMAKKQYMKSIFLNPGYVEAYQNLGDVYRQEQKWDSASYYLRQGLSIRPNHPDLLTNLGNVCFDQIYSQKAKKEELIRDAGINYIAALKSDSNCLEANLGLGHCYWEKAKYDSASICYKKCIALDSNVLDYKNYYIESLTRDGKISLAEKLSNGIARQFPSNAQNWFDLGVLAVVQKNDALAETRFQKAISLGIKSKSAFTEEPLLSGFRQTKRYKTIVKALTE